MSHHVVGGSFEDRCASVCYGGARYDGVDVRDVSVPESLGGGFCIDGRGGVDLDDVQSGAFSLGDVGKGFCAWCGGIADAGYNGVGGAREESGEDAAANAFIEMLLVIFIDVRGG